jgi:predicted ferric reductase
MVAGFSSLILLFIIFLKRRNYEIFHLVHSVLAAVIIIMSGLHRPELAQKSSYGLIFCATIWGLDRLLRTLRLIIHGFGNKATLIPLPHGGTKIVLRKAPKGAKADMHIWLHLLSVRKCELHPFTIVSTQPLEMVVAAQDGFTRDLHKFSVKSPGVEIAASLDGPYGSVPDFRGLTRVVFIAGGSCGSYTSGVTVDFLRSLVHDCEVAIDFIWVVRHTGEYLYFSQV